MRRDLIVLPSKMRKEEYDNYHMTQDVITAIFKNSVNQPISKAVKHVPSIYTDELLFAYLDDDILERMEGSMPLATAVALYGSPTKEQVIEIVKIIAKEKYSNFDYLWFKNFCSQASHWLNIVTSLEAKKPVTVVINHHGRGRIFTNIVGYSNSNVYPNNIWYNSFKLVGIKNWISLEELCEMLETAPWIWNI